MPENAEELDKILEKIGPKTLPFARWKRDKEIEWYEIKDFSHLAFSPTTLGEIPPNAIIFKELSEIITKTEIRENGKYLWVINKEAELLILLEVTENKDNEIRGHICHSNLTKGEEAYQGGELWFMENGEVYITFSSGRYHAFNKLQEEGVLEYFKYKGYDVKCHPNTKRKK